ncbi:MAG: hypothetical protein Q4G54_04310 [Pelistega sp.]|nr:hypothetical protein [Pelistega sp.]
MDKMPVIDVFMTAEDERMISEEIKAEFGDKVVFIDCYAWPNRDLKSYLRSSLDLCHGALNSGGAILNTNITSLDFYEKNYIAQIGDREEYHAADVGPGLIQVLHSPISQYSPGGLRGGRFAASYDSIEEADTGDFVKQVYKIIKKHFKKVYRMDPVTKDLEAKPDSRLLAGPDAIEKYDQMNGLYLTLQHYAYYTSKK